MDHDELVDNEKEQPDVALDHDLAIHSEGVRQPCPTIRMVSWLRMVHHEQTLKMRA